jgi:hypothetical protein
VRGSEQFSRKRAILENIIQIDHGYFKRMNNPCLSSCLHIVCKLDRGKYQIFYMQNHAPLTPFVNNNILSKQMIYM